MSNNNYNGGKPPQKRRPPPQQGVGDIYTRREESEQRYWDTEERSEYLPYISSPVSRPQTTEEDVKKKLGDLAPVVDYFLVKLIEKLRCSWLSFKRPSYLEPPAFSLPLDCFTPCNGIAIPAGPLLTPVVVLSCPTSERFVSIFLSIGNMLKDPMLCCNIKWQIRINGRPVKPYESFDISLGHIDAPIAFGSPLIARPNELFELLIISNSGPATKAFARTVGFIYPIKDRTFDGNFEAFHTIY